MFGSLTTVCFDTEPGDRPHHLAWCGRSPVSHESALWSAAEHLQVPGLLPEMVQLHVRLIGPVLRPRRQILGPLRQLGGLIGLALRTGRPLLQLIGLPLSLLRQTFGLLRLALRPIRLTLSLLRLMSGLLRLMTSLLRLLNRLDRALVRDLGLIVHLPRLPLHLTCEGRSLARGLAGVLCVYARLITEGLALDLRHFRIPPGHIDLVACVDAFHRPLFSYVLCCHIRAPFQKVWVLLGRTRIPTGLILSDAEEYRSRFHTINRRSGNTRGSTPLTWRRSELGRSRDSELNELPVKPAGPDGPIVVATVTGTNTSPTHSEAGSSSPAMFRPLGRVFASQ